jgi:hypothetical protein
MGREQQKFSSGLITLALVAGAPIHCLKRISSAKMRDNTQKLFD